MFEEFKGLPLHPFVVHAAVVLIPLLVLGAVVYTVAPRLRTRLRWAVTALSVAAPLAALFAKLSGDAFRQRLIDRNVLGPNSPALLDRVNQHRTFGDITLWFTIALAVATLLLVFVTSRRSSAVPRWGRVVLGILVIALAAGSGYYVFWAGDYGARAVWEGF